MKLNKTILSKYITRLYCPAMPTELYAYVIVSLVFLLIARNLYVVIQPTLLALFFVAAEMKM